LEPVDHHVITSSRVKPEDRLRAAIHGPARRGMDCRASLAIVSLD
jgi:hypothetical protein